LERIWKEAIVTVLSTGILYVCVMSAYLGYVTCNDGCETLSKL